MTDSRFEVRLKQHTPMVHFQHEQDGATLRATELKPKLDRYVRRHLNGNADERLRYQVRIQPLGEPIVNNEKPHGLYFGKVGRARQHDQVTLTVNTYFDAGLAAAVRQAIPECFALENFGTRQNKGFGSFYPDETHTDPPLPAIETVLKSSGKPIYYFGVGKSDEPLDFIEALYKAMKSGINETKDGKLPKRYLKSLIWQYFNEGRTPPDFLNWEKRFSKKMLLGEIIDDPWYLRAVLGTTGGFFFKATNGERRMDSDYEDVEPFKINGNVTVKVSNSRIKRFKSPITFKPAGQKVYIILNQNDYRAAGLNVLGETFEFKIGKYSGTLKVPSKGPDDKPFRLETLMDFVMQRINDKTSLKENLDPDWDKAKRLFELRIERLKGDSDA